MKTKYIWNAAIEMEQIVPEGEGGQLRGNRNVVLLEQTIIENLPYVSGITIITQGVGATGCEDRE